MKKINEIKAMSLAEVFANGMVVAFIEGNREIVKKNVQNQTVTATVSTLFIQVTI